MEAEIRGLCSFFLSITTLCFWGVWAGKQWQWQCSHAESLQSCPTLSHPVDCSPPGSSVHGILQARILSGSPFPVPGDLPNPGIKPSSLMSPWLASAGRFLTTSATWTGAEQQRLVAVVAAVIAGTMPRVAGALIIVRTVSGFLPGTVLRTKISISSLIAPTHS